MVAKRAIARRLTFAMLGIAMSSASLAQTVLSDFECRSTINEALNRIRIVDPEHPDAYSFTLRMDATQTINDQTTTYTSLLRWYNDQPGPRELIRAELWNLRGSTILHRLVADGTRVWSHFVPQNEYTVTRYDGETPPQSANYRNDFTNMFKNPVQGLAQNLMAIGSQVGIPGAARVKDTLGGIPFEGVENSGMRIMWQTTVDESWFVKYVCQPIGASWELRHVEFYRSEWVGAKLRESRSFVTVVKDQHGVPVPVDRNSPDLMFTPPLGSRLLTQPRAIKF